MIPMLNMLDNYLKNLFDPRPSMCKSFYLQKSSVFKDNLQIKDDPNAEHTGFSFVRIV